jgi:hypothetical protein
VLLSQKEMNIVIALVTLAGTLMTGIQLAGMWRSRADLRSPRSRIIFAGRVALVIACNVLVFSLIEKAG